MDKKTTGVKGDNYRKRYPLAQITNAAYKRLLARVDRQVIKLDNLKARIEDLEEALDHPRRRQAPALGEISDEWICYECNVKEQG